MNEVFRRFKEVKGLEPVEKIEAISFGRALKILSAYYAYNDEKEITDALEGIVQTPNAYYSFHKANLIEL